MQSNHPELTRTCLFPPSSQSFEEVQCCRTSRPIGLLPNASQLRFGVVKPPRTHSKLPCRPASPCITVVRGGSVRSNHPELIHSGSRRFGVVEPPRTHSKLPCRPASSSSIVVRGGLVRSNHPKLTRTDLQACFPLHHSGSRRFGVVPRN